MKFIVEKSEQGSLNLNEPINEVFEDDTKESIEKMTLINTLKRCQKMIEDANSHLDKAHELLEIRNLKTDFKITTVHSYLKNFQKGFPGISFINEGENYNVNIDEYSFDILLSNLLENANKHGFKDTKNPAIKFKTELNTVKFGSEFILVQYFNNGAPLPESINTESFLKKGSKSKNSAGDGYGGFLISEIVKLHNGYIEVDKDSIEKEPDFNVCFNIYLPKN
jgi:K+-sensing histidine kinase KdpD